MGRMRFIAPNPERFTEPALRAAYITGLDLTPTPTQMDWDDDGLLVAQRDNHESGNLHIAWSVADRGELFLQTGSLMQRERPYLLPVELARGTLNRLRTQADHWRLAGLQLSDEFLAQVRENTNQFSQAAMSQHQPEIASQAAEQSIEQSVAAIDELGRAFAAQVLNFRKEHTPELPTLLAGNMGGGAMPEDAEPMFGATFNTAVCPFTWRLVQRKPDTWRWNVFEKQIRLSHRHGLKVFGGPLLQLEEGVLPDWILHGDADFEQLSHWFGQYVAATVQKFRGDVHVWVCSAGTNRRVALGLTDEQRMRLTIQSIEATRRYDPRTPLVICVDQPWGEYMTSDVSQLPPLHFAETLIRADLGIAGIGLELNFGYSPNGSETRDVLEVHELINRWSLLGLPLICMLTVPSCPEDDPQIFNPAYCANSAMFAGDQGTHAQKDYVERLLPMLLAKQSVHSIVWNEVFDSVPHKFPHSGLFDADDRPKPALSSLLAARRDHLS